MCLEVFLRVLRWQALVLKNIWVINLQILLHEMIKKAPSLTCFILIWIDKIHSAKIVLYTYQFSF